MAGTVTAYLPITAAGAVTLKPLSLSGVLSEVFTATGALHLTAAVLAGSGLESFTSSGALSFRMVLAGSSLELFTSAGALALGAVHLTGAAREDFYAFGAPNLHSFITASVGSERFSGAGSLHFRLVLEGVGFVPEGPIVYIPPDKILLGAPSASFARKHPPQQGAPAFFIGVSVRHPAKVPTTPSGRAKKPPQQGAPAFFIGVSVCHPAKVPTTPSGRAKKPKPG
jgi:hypothetical protein